MSTPLPHRPASSDGLPGPSGPPSALEEVQGFWSRVILTPWARRRALLYQELAGLTASGHGIREAIELLCARHGGQALTFLAPMREAVGQGRPLGPAMLGRREVYTPLEAGLVSSLERAGRLDEAFHRAADVMEDRIKMRNRLLGAMGYPFLLVNFGLVVMPIGPIWMNHGFFAYLGWVILVLGMLWGGAALLVSIHVGLAMRSGYAQFVGAIPLVGHAARAAAVERFARAMAALHGAGLGLGDCLDAAAEASANGWLAADLRRAAARVHAGETVTEALTASSAIPQEVWNSIASGERAGELEASLTRTADLYRDRSRAALAAAAAGFFVLALLVVGAGIFAFYFVNVIKPLRDVLSMR